MAFWTDRPVFITGATGLLGSHMTQELLARGANPVCLVRDQVAHSHFVRLGLDKQVVIVRGCLEDYALLERSLNEHEIDTVLHGLHMRNVEAAIEYRARMVGSMLALFRAVGGEP